MLMGMGIGLKSTWGSPIPGSVSNISSCKLVMWAFGKGVDSQIFETGWHSLTLGMDASSGTSVGAKETVDTSDSQPRGIWIWRHYGG